MSIISRNVINQDTFQTFSDSKKWKVYSEIYNENLRLIEQYKELYHSTDDNLIFNKLDDLSRENLSLKEKINKLEITCIKQTHEINELKEKVNELTIDNIQLKGNVNYMMNFIDSLKNKNLYDKIVIAIQDVNRLYKLSQTIPSLKQLNTYRISECHYINDNDTQLEVDNKLIILSDILQNMPAGVQMLFNTTFPTVVNAIIPHINNIGTIASLNPITKQQLELWFN